MTILLLYIPVIMALRIRGVEGLTNLVIIAMGFIAEVKGIFTKVDIAYRFLCGGPKAFRIPGANCDDLIGLVDLMATFAEVVGAELPADAGEDSQSFAKILSDSDTSP